MAKSAHTQEYRTFRVLLRSSRENAGLTQKDVAEILGVSQSYVSKYESGERRLDVIELLAVCDAIGVSATRFVDSLKRRLRRS